LIFRFELNWQRKDRSLASLDSSYRVQREQAPLPQKRPWHPIYLNELVLIQTKALNLYENYYKLRDRICHYRAIACPGHAEWAQG
jgi:hypothetical protein